MSDSLDKKEEKALLAFATPASYGLATFVGIFGGMAFFALSPLAMALIEKGKGTKDLSGKKKWLTWGIFGVAAFIPCVLLTSVVIPGPDPVEVAKEEVVESIQEVIEPGSSEEVVGLVEEVIEPEPVEPEWVRPSSGNDPKWVTADCANVPDIGSPYALDAAENTVAFRTRQKECYPPKEKTAPVPQAKATSPAPAPVSYSDSDTRNQYATTYGQFRQVGFGHGEAADKTRDFLNKNGFNYDALGNVNRTFRLGVKECWEEMNDSFCGRSSY